MGGKGRNGGMEGTSHTPPYFPYFPYASFAVPKAPILCYTREKHMTQTEAIPSGTETQAQSVTAILSRISVPAFLFSLALTAILGVSRVTLLPMLTAVNVGGVSRDTEELQIYSQKLTTEIEGLSSERDQSLMPLQGTPYAKLVALKALDPTLPEVLSLFSSTASTVLPDQSEAIVLLKISFTPDDRSIVLKGDVRGVGPQSMTVLAQLVETLRNHPRVAEVVSPAFSRSEDPEIGMHSPFTLTLTLR